LTTSDYSDGLDVDDNVSNGVNAQSLGHYVSSANKIEPISRTTITKIFGDD